MKSIFVYDKWIMFQSMHSAVMWNRMNIIPRNMPIQYINTLNKNGTQLHTIRTIELTKMLIAYRCAKNVFVLPTNQILIGLEICI